MPEKKKTTRRTSASAASETKRRAPRARKTKAEAEEAQLQLDVSTEAPASEAPAVDVSPTPVADLPEAVGGVYSFEPDESQTPAARETEAPAPAAPEAAPVHAERPSDSAQEPVQLATSPEPAEERSEAPRPDGAHSSPAHSPSHGADHGDREGQEPGDEDGPPGGQPQWFGKGYWKERKKLKKAQKYFEKRFGKPAPGTVPPVAPGAPVPGAVEAAPLPAEGAVSAPAAAPVPAAHPAPHAAPHGGSPRLHGRDRGERPDRPERPERYDRGERGDRGERPERAGFSTPKVDHSRFADAAALEQLASTLFDPASGEPLRLDQVQALPTGQLADVVRSLGLTPSLPLNRRALYQDIVKAGGAQKRLMLDTGILDATPDGNGFIVHAFQNYRVDGQVTFVPESVIRKFGLRRGHEVEVQCQSPQEGESAPAALVVRSVMGMEPEAAKKLTAFEDLIPYYPLRRILLETPEVARDISMRTVDLLTPVGFGQRGLIVAPPRTGKTVLMQNMANSITRNHPDATLIVLLVDERPEEVTDFRRTVKGEVVSSTFDESAESHVHLAEVVIEKCRRLVETGRHVVILLDSITRLARAYNTLASNSGKIMSGGIEASALQKPKRFFGSARNIEDGGSLTILGTALVDTGSKMDEVIFEEFKGTGNMELHLDRTLVEKRIFPALNIEKSGTRKEELIYHPEEMLRIHSLRRAMQGVPGVEAMEMLLTRLKKSKTNAEFLMSMSR